MNKEETQAKAAETQTIEAADGQDLLDKIIKEGRWKDPASRTLARDMIGELAKQVLEGQILVGKDTEAMINSRSQQPEKKEGGNE